MSARPNAAPLTALVDVLARHRMLLFAIYLGVVGVYAAGVYLGGFLNGFLFAPLILDFVVPGRDSDLDLDLADFSSGDPFQAIWFVTGLLALQALFLFGGGRIPLGKKPAVVQTGRKGNRLDRADR